MQTLNWNNGFLEAESAEFTVCTSRFSPSLIHGLCVFFASNSRFMRLFQAALDTPLDSPFSATLSVHGLHFTVYVPSIRLWLSGKEEAHKHKQMFPVPALVGGGSPDLSTACSSSTVSMSTPGGVRLGAPEPSCFGQPRHQKMSTTQKPNVSFCRKKRFWEKSKKWNFWWPWAVGLFVAKDL